jgi:hypothetical protein
VCTVKKERKQTLAYLNLLAEHYEIYEKGVDFQINQLKSYVSFANGVIALKEGVDASRMTGTSIYRWRGTLQTKVKYGRPGVNMKLA